MSRRVPSFPLRPDQKILIGLALLSVALAIGMPAALTPQDPTAVETSTTTHVESSLTTFFRYETKTVATTCTYTYGATSLLTMTYTMTYYVTTVIYTTAFYGPFVTGIYGHTIVIPIPIERTQTTPTTVQRTTTESGQRIITETKESVSYKVTTVAETTMHTKTLPYHSAILRTYSQNLAWLLMAAILPVLAYHRISAYRTRLHIYYEILDYTSYSSRMPSHIMRACNLETTKFEKYIETLVEKGFIDEIRRDEGRQYRASRKGLDLIRDEKLSQFVRELP